MDKNCTHHLQTRAIKELLLAESLLDRPQESFASACKHVHQVRQKIAKQSQTSTLEDRVSAKFYSSSSDLRSAICIFKMALSSSHPSPYNSIVACMGTYLTALCVFCLLSFSIFSFHFGSINPRAWLNLRFMDFAILSAQQDHGTLQRNISFLGKPLSIAGVKYDYGLGTHANSKIVIQLPYRANTFEGAVGIDDGAGKLGDATFWIKSGDRVLWKSPLLHGRDASVPFKVNVNGGDILTLLVDTGPTPEFNGDHADWVLLHAER